MNIDRRQILIIAGEASGDLHASGLLREYHLMDPETQFFGVGGDLMIEQGLDAVFCVNEVAFLGFVEVIRHLPFIRKVARALIEECRRRKPAAVVLVDYPGFNLRFAAKLRQIPELAAVPILYYISPQVWAWHASRVPKIAKLIDRMAVIFDFEVSIYEKAGLKTDFVGHPLLEIAKPAESETDFRRSLSIDPEAPLLALLPGSRMQEVKRLLVLFVRTFQLLKTQFPQLKALVGCSPSLSADFYRNILRQENISCEDLVLLEGRTHDIVAHSNIALVASDTATLETAVSGTPLVMAYKVSPLTYWIGRHLIKIPNLALVNVVAGKRIVPEFIQSEARPENIAAELAQLLTDELKRLEMIAELDLVRQKLGAPGASRKVAEILHEMVSEKLHRA